VCIGSCGVAMCRWSTWPELSSLTGFSTRSQSLCCITVLSGSLDLWHILMHWVTFRCVKVRTRVRRLNFDGLGPANPLGVNISPVSNSTSDANLFFCAVLKCCVGQCASVPAQSSHWHNSYWPQTSFSCLAEKIWKCNSVKYPETVNRPEVAAQTKRVYWH
jgi:hypothetical protein